MNTTTDRRHLTREVLAGVRPPYPVERLTRWLVKYTPLPLEHKLAVRK